MSPGAIGQACLWLPPPPGLLLCTCSPLFVFKAVQFMEGGLRWGCQPCGLAARIFPLSSRVGHRCLWVFWSSAGFGGQCCSVAVPESTSTMLALCLKGQRPWSSGAGVASQEPGISLECRPFPFCVLMSWAPQPSVAPSVTYVHLPRTRCYPPAPVFPAVRDIVR